MAIDTAESAVADNVNISRLSEFERVLALLGDRRGFCFESGDLKVSSVFWVYRLTSLWDTNTGYVPA